MFTRAFLLTSLPKSGTVYLQNWIQLMLMNHASKISDSLVINDPSVITNPPVMNIGASTFPKDILDLSKILDILDKKGVGIGHFDCSHQNIQVIEQLKMPVIVHIRDPRSSLLSWIHHSIRLIKEGQEVQLLRNTPKPPIALFDESLADIIDWHLDNYLSAQCRWISEWRKYSSKNPLVQMKTFSELKENPLQYIASICKFIGTNEETILAPPNPEDGVHFRKGLVDEWKDAFSKSQREKADRMLKKFSIS
jgi:hypothetical protein